MNAYLPRTLTFNRLGKQERIDELEILGLDGPAIVLGEPGMGKTRLLRRLAEEAGTIFRSAASFVAHPDPASLVPTGVTLIIDGLDELSAAQESDPVYRVLGQLIKAGCPRFVLSCRAADWRGAVARQDISEEYGVKPYETALDPLDHDGAITFLEPSLGLEKAQSTVESLDARGLSEFYGNPLTLSLVGEVSDEAGALPETRPKLLERACAVMWNERSDRHDMSLLSNLDEDSALAAAGAACAALILTGSEAIAIKPSSAGQPHTLPLAALTALPKGENIRSLVGSRLFARNPEAVDQFKPIHRSIAEYLGARWLCSQADNALSRERVLAMITFDAGVPASLRGIHAWLAHFGPDFAADVIANDPYGVLRYGDADGLTIEQGRVLLHALKQLQADSPYFRAEDWSRHSAKGLAQINLLDDLRDILFAADTNFHLRSVLLEAIHGSPVARALVDDLRGIVFEQRQPYTYRERHDAATALVELDANEIGWSRIVATLVSQGDEDSTRLALDIIDDVGYDGFSATEIADAMLAYLGLLDSSSTEERSTAGNLHLVGRRLPDDRIEEILDRLGERMSQRDREIDWHASFEFAGLAIRLITRRIASGDPDPVKLINWLRIAPGRHGYSEDDRELAEYLIAANDVRRAIQRRIMFVERDPDQVWSRVWRMGGVHRGLSLALDDVIYFLNELAEKPDPTAEDVEIWRELAAFSRRTDGRAGDILAAAQPFAIGNPELEDHLFKLSQPAQPTDWEIEHGKRERRDATKREKALKQHRQDFSKNEAVLRAGEFRWIYPVSQAYLCLFTDSDKSLPPPDRIGQWLGSALQVAGIEGLEAVLRRADLPTVDQIAESYAESRRWNFIYPMIAAVTERVRQRRGLDDLPLDLIIAIRIALHHEPLGDRVDTEGVTAAVDATLRADPALYERYVRLLIEPSLERRRSYITGLYSFVRTTSDRAVAHRLALEWLQRFPDMPVEVEAELVDLLTGVGDFETLRRLVQARAVRAEPDAEQRRNWIATGILVDFATTAAAVGTIGEDKRALLWHVRHRFGGDRDRPAPPASAVQLAWIIHQFRGHWPDVSRPSSVTNGDTNPWDASRFLHSMINQLAADTSAGAAAAFVELIAAPTDDYTPALRYAADQQRRARREINFPGVTLDRLRAVITDQPPASTSDLLAIVRFTLTRLQAQLRGSDTDAIEKYYRDDSTPRDEDSCTDRLIEDIERLMPPLGIGRIPQRDMPTNKRADITFTYDDFELPVECKGQWNATLWSAADTQLDQLYLRDWRSQDRGLYIVYWFGGAVASMSKLRAPPRDMTRPPTPNALRAALLSRIPPERRGSIAIEVLDLTR
jgi:hypothetical protein